MIIIESKLAEVLALHLGDGSHDGLDKGLCVMEAVSYVAGEPWSDHPKCACPVIAAFMRSWNDSLPNDVERDRLLKPLIHDLVDSKSTPRVEERRSYLALDWLVRVFTPKWLDMMPALAKHAKALRDLEEIADMAGAAAAGKIVNAARAAARDAASASAWAAASAAARAAAAAWNAASAAASASAWAAACAAASAAFKPTTEWLQASAIDLVHRMLAVQPIVAMGAVA